VSGSTLFWLIVGIAVAGWVIGAAIYRLRAAWATSSVRNAARNAAPSVESLAVAIATFHERFPVADVSRLPMELDDYPQPRSRNEPRPGPPYEFACVDGYWYRTGGLALEVGEKVRLPDSGRGEWVGTVLSCSNSHPRIPRERMKTILRKETGGDF
jgi:hypothetical protein